MKFNIISIFPEIFSSYFNEGIMKRAIEKKIIKIKAHNLRDFTDDKRKTVDDTVYGGGAGMLLKIEPLYKAIKKIAKKRKIAGQKIILLSAKGKKWDQQMAKKYSKLKSITLICGRYEGVDERIKNFIDEEISVGDYVLSGGEIGAMVIVDSVSRLLPKVLGNKESIEDESHQKSGELEYPQYTKPATFKAGKKEYKVPKELTSGNHKVIEEWKKSHKTKTA
ncbi:tRNA (guanosine(37)-N1)-methyltransferase TrmD [Candidatus Falkowbacteria bacterium HGW-Falkowbacteria-1]|jgi:tRNA (guanine37-N1)-methyltransferase|uniref:tRNA (guanine-N(1)-)-methyltransferase n=1 Tax=Candidatus Falkowbacteria bacterium HGW-Falkowbacteria-1 TaxID=2013768 RepID=A0A2N2E8M8_9BACT|nr:MAG: tRNA (guanosine(37)-N1)-methyltransferase TrmD [Candidatus Falkowbacteria bacterium HGW-Falkowbacteria-1]